MHTLGERQQPDNRVVRQRRVLQIASKRQSFMRRNTGSMYIMIKTEVPSGTEMRPRRGDYAVSVEVLNMLFTEWKTVVHFHELALQQPLACDSIAWPELSSLRVLSLNISGKTSWRLDTLLPHLSLESLTLTLNEESENVGLMVADCVAIGMHITAATYLKELCFFYIGRMLF